MQRVHVTYRAMVRWYYVLATPAFWLIDLTWDAPLRASFVPDERVRYAYYAGCIGCGVLMWKQPALSRGIGLTESVANFTMSLLAIWIPMLTAYDAATGVGPDPQFNVIHPINAGLSGAAALLSYYSNQRHA